MRELSLVVPRTARCALFGPEPSAADEWWIVFHGYGQLAAEFLGQCAALDNGRRLVVAPEGLSRFYQRGPGGATPSDAVGASWMTRESRASEIADYLNYLDLLLDELRTGIAEMPPLHVLGFSQGTATAARWCAHTDAPIARFVCWGGVLPPELDLHADTSPLRNTRLQLVVGTRDVFATPERVAVERQRLDVSGLPYDAITFEGGHRLDNATLRALAER